MINESDLLSLLEKAAHSAFFQVEIEPEIPFQGKIITFSPSLPEITGINDPYDFNNWTKNLNPEDYARIIKSFQDFWQNNPPYDELVRVFNPQKQKWVWLRILAFPNPDQQNKRTIYNGLVMDITRQKQAEEGLKYQAEFEKLITGISTSFINLKANQIDHGIEKALEKVGKFVGVERSYVFLYSEDGTTLSNTHEWCLDGTIPLIHDLQNIPFNTLQWSNQRFLQGEVLYLQSLDELPLTAQAELDLFQSQNVQSLVSVPMTHLNRVIGFVGFDSIEKRMIWSPEIITLLKMVGEIIANALALKKAQEIQDSQQKFLELLASEGTFNETLTALVDIIEEQCPGMLGLILLMDSDEQTLHVGASSSLPQDYLDETEGLKIGPSVGSCGTAAYTRQRVIVTDIEHDPRWENLRELALCHDLKACWSEPIFSSEGQVIGTFAMYYRYPRIPSENELHIIETAAHLAGVAIQHKRSQEELRNTNITLEQRVNERTHEIERKRKVAEGLKDILTQLNSNHTLDEILDFIVQQADQLLETSVVALYLLDSSSQQLHLTAYQGLAAEEIKKLNIEQAEGASCQCVFENEPIAIENVYQMKKNSFNFSNNLIEHFKAFLTIPLTARKEVYGCLALYYPQPRNFSEEEISLAVTFAEQAALAIQNARLIQIEQDRKKELENLYRQTQRRADEVQTLFTVQQAITSRLDLDAVLQMIADEAQRLTETSMSAVYLLEQDHLIISVVAGDVNRNILGYKVPLTDSVAGLALKTGKSYLINHSDAKVRNQKELTDLVSAKSFLIVPLMSSTGPIGTITVANKTPSALSKEDENVLSMLASGAVVAIENARYYQSEQEKRKEADRRRKAAEGLQEVLSALNSNLPSDRVFEIIITQAKDLVGASAALLKRGNFNKRSVSIEASSSLPEELFPYCNSPLNWDEKNDWFFINQPVILPEIQHEYKPSASDTTLQTLINIIREKYHSYLSVPLIIEGEEFRDLTFLFEEKQVFTDLDVQIAASISDQASLAIQNADLRSRAEKSAVTAERNRLARDLHDAVTQTLFSASLIAEVLPRLWKKNPQEAERRLEELRQLTRGALAEMRTLLMELRPTALMESEIEELFHQLSDAFVGRTRIPVTAEIQQECNLQPDVKIALYRIAQESLNNVAKHARATQVYLELSCESECTILKIRDNGRGFDPKTIPPDHLGVSIMKERADSIGATLLIRSEINQGTEITAVWAEKKEK